MTRPAPPVLAIVDPCCPAPYAPRDLSDGTLGGTEATVLRVTRALAARMTIVHFQRARGRVEATDAGQMVPLSAAFAVTLPHATYVVINAWKVACKLRKLHPQARILLWLHVHPGKHNRPMAEALAKAGIGIVCVSHSHEAQLRIFLGHGAAPRITHIYNPIAEGLQPDDTPRDPNRMLFASSPHKGLAQVFRQFRTVRATLPDLTLAVADPGYLAWNTGPPPQGVTFLGTLRHAALIGEMRRASCLFYPQTTFAETFGLVLAEAQAVGLPVLAHRGLGANSEVVEDPEQLIDGTDPATLVARLTAWGRQPPEVRANPAFRLEAVAARWADLLGLDSVAAPARWVA